METGRSLTAQAEWEVEGTNRAIRRYRDAATHKELHELPAGQQLMRELVPPLTAVIQQAQQDAVDLLLTRGAPGNRTQSWALQLVPADVMAVITVARTLMSYGGGEAPSITPLAISVASEVRAQVEYDRWLAGPEDGNNPLDKHLRFLAQKRPEATPRAWRRWRAAVLPVREQRWAKSTKVLLGTTLLHLLASSAPHRFTIAMRHRPGGLTQLVLEMTEATLEEMTDRNTRAEVGRPMLMPMLIPPNPWQYETKEAA
jgi:DNA-directed RNA polymerase